MNNKKNLKMKPVGSEYRYNALLRYVFQVTEQELSSIGWQERRDHPRKISDYGKGRCHWLV